MNIGTRLLRRPTERVRTLREPKGEKKGFELPLNLEGNLIVLCCPRFTSCDHILRLDLTSHSCSPGIADQRASFLGRLLVPLLVGPSGLLSTRVKVIADSLVSQPEPYCRSLSPSCSRGRPVAGCHVPI